MRILILFLMFVLLQSSVMAANNVCLDATNPVQLLNHASQYAKITGIISNVAISERSKVIFLNFGNNYNTSFSAMIYDSSLPEFIMAGIDEPAEYFKNKNVSLEGIIRISNGKPEMIIDSPSQIKILNNT